MPDRLTDRLVVFGPAIAGCTAYDPRRCVGRYVQPMASNDSTVARIDEEPEAITIRIRCLDDIRLPIEAWTRDVGESAVIQPPHDGTGR
ncbi:hypothetical protein ASF20_00200 [Methylobacterium sp. Leaf88]|nr:hypothetical protein ASF20_00200 [Methylobacterium sp. Leaf88]